MPKRIDAPSVVEAAGNKPKRIEELVGRVTRRANDRPATNALQAPP